ncbi:MAG: DUF4188 domain-containing protein [Methylococcales bacterium]|nr:DUF4188 domain-containing protein [Methylococcales bacterium]
MIEIIKGRMTAETKDDFVVFMIGMRINSLWKIHQWLPVAMAMPKMLKELYKNPEMGLISHEQWFGRTTIMIQYWKSFEHLEHYAKSKTLKHLPEWKKFNKNIGNNGDVGIWHETYLLKQGSYESVYNNMPKFGLAKATTCVPATGKYQTANERINQTIK